MGFILYVKFVTFIYQIYFLHFDLNQYAGVKKKKKKQKLYHRYADLHDRVKVNKSLKIAVNLTFYDTRLVQVVKCHLL